MDKVGVEQYLLSEQRGHEIGNTGHGAGSPEWGAPGGRATGQLRAGTHGQACDGRTNYTQCHAGEVRLGSYR